MIAIDRKDQPLVCEVTGDELVIRIGIDTLAFADKERREYTARERYTILNTLGFAEDVVRELEHEDELGATLLTDLLDKAMDEAIDSGSQFVEKGPTFDRD